MILMWLQTLHMSTTQRIMAVYSFNITLLAQEKLNDDLRRKKRSKDICKQLIRVNMFTLTKSNVHDLRFPMSEV